MSSIQESAQVINKDCIVDLFSFKPATEDGKTLREVALILEAIKRRGNPYVTLGIVSYLARKENMYTHLTDEDAFVAFKKNDTNLADD